MIFCLAGLFAAQGCSYKEMVSLTDWAIVGNIATMDIRTGQPFDTAKLFSSEHLRKLDRQQSIYICFGQVTPVPMQAPPLWPDARST